MTLSRAVVAVALLLAACDGSAAGTRAYREGRFDEAHRAYAAAADAAGAGIFPPAGLAATGRLDLCQHFVGLRRICAGHTHQ